MTNSEHVTAAAEAIAGAYASGVGCAPVKDLLTPSGIDGAYAAQEILTGRALAAGRKLVGRKIGLTSKAVQTQLGVDQPDYGMLFADMEISEHEEIAASRFIAPRVEAEIAFVLGRDLDDAELPLGRLVQAIDFALPAIEIVDSRIADWKISILDTIADNASSGAYVLGGAPVKIDTLDLRLCGMVMEHQGEAVSIGCGAACLGNPLAAALWLARTMARSGRPLKAGDTILSGALGPMIAAKAGGAYQARIKGLGSVNVRFAA
ncbi:MAG: 2-keto-4-pentenoate hydratase [Sphingomonadales bacterium]|nr:MAG: 2-keto-4-pentenoate hydratase [Sphingomonadales bacterium]